MCNQDMSMNDQRRRPAVNGKEPERRDYTFEVGSSAADRGRRDHQVSAELGDESIYSLRVVSMHPDRPEPSSGPRLNKPQEHEAAKSPELSYAGDCGAWVASSPDMGMMLVRWTCACSPCVCAWATE